MRFGTLEDGEVTRAIVESERRKKEERDGPERASRQTNSNRRLSEKEEETDEKGNDH